MSSITSYHAKYFAHELSIIHANNGVDRLSQSLFDASVLTLIKLKQLYLR